MAPKQLCASFVPIPYYSATRIHTHPPLSLSLSLSLFLSTSLSRALPLSSALHSTDFVRKLSAIVVLFIETSAANDACNCNCVGYLRYLHVCIASAEKSDIFGFMHMHIQKTTMCFDIDNTFDSKCAVAET